MTHRGGIALAILLAALAVACRENPGAPLRLFPEKVGVWRRTSLREMAAGEAPDPVPRSEVARMEAAGYEGAGQLETRVYELTSPTVGAALAQRWRPSADTVFFSHGRYFVVIHWQQAERQALRDFVRDLEGRMKE